MAFSVDTEIKEKEVKIGIYDSLEKKVTSLNFRIEEKTAKSTDALDPIGERSFVLTGGRWQTVFLPTAQGDFLIPRPGIYFLKQ